MNPVSASLSSALFQDSSVNSMRSDLSQGSFSALLSQFDAPSTASSVNQPSPVQPAPPPPPPHDAAPPSSDSPSASQTAMQSEQAQAANAPPPASEQTSSNTSAGATPAKAQAASADSSSSDAPVADQPASRKAKATSTDSSNSGTAKSKTAKTADPDADGSLAAQILGSAQGHSVAAQQGADDGSTAATATTTGASGGHGHADAKTVATNDPTAASADASAAADATAVAQAAAPSAGADFGQQLSKLVAQGAAGSTVNDAASALAGVTGSATATGTSATATAAGGDPVSVTLAQPLTDAGFAPELAARVSVLAADGVQHAELHLNPADMGPVAVQISVSGQQAQVTFHAAQANTRSVLEQSLPDLAAALAASGLTLSGGGVFQQSSGQSQYQGNGSGSGANSQNTRTVSGTTGTTAAISHAAQPMRASRGVVDLYA